MSRIQIIAPSIGICAALMGCGSLTGLPGHGGGKRYALEQEMVSTSVRETIQKMNLQALSDGIPTKVSVFIISDQGSGDIVGGRLSLSTLFHSEISGKRDAASYYGGYSYYDGLSTAVPSSTQLSSSLTGTASMSAGSDRPYAYAGGGSGSDEQYIQAIVMSELLKAGITIEDSSQPQNCAEDHSNDPHSGDSADATEKQADFIKNKCGSPKNTPTTSRNLNFYFDTIGAIRERFDTFFENIEIYKIRTVIQVVGIQSTADNQKNVIISKKSGTEAVYLEKYILWNGPFSIKQYTHDYKGSFNPQKASQPNNN